MELGQMIERVQGNIQKSEEDLKQIQHSLQSNNRDFNVFSKGISKIDSVIEFLLDTQDQLEAYFQQVFTKENSQNQNSEDRFDARYTQIASMLKHQISSTYRRKALVLTMSMRNNAVSFEDIWSSLQEAQKYNPTDPEVYRTMGRIIRMKGDIELGIAYMLSLTMIPIGTAPHIYITLAELIACRGMTGVEKEQRQQNQSSDEGLVKNAQFGQFGSQAGLQAGLQVGLYDSQDDVGIRGNQHRNQIRESDASTQSKIRGDSELLKELLEMLLYAPMIDLRLQIRLWKELSVQDCLYGLERWKKRMEEEYQDVLSNNQDALFHKLQNHDISVREALSFLEAGISEKRLELSKLDPSRSDFMSNSHGHGQLANLEQQVERNLTKISDYWEGLECLASFYLEQGNIQQARHWCNLALAKSSKRAEVLCIHACILLEESTSAKRQVRQFSSILDRSQYQNYNMSGSSIQDSIQQTLQNNSDPNPTNISGYKDNTVQQDVQLARQIFVELCSLPFVFSSIRKRAIVMMKIVDLQIKLKK